MRDGIPFNEIGDGMEIPILAVDFSPERNDRYCRLVNEINPLHFDAQYARSLGYRDIVIAGVFTASFFPKLLTDWLGTGVRIERMEVRFFSPAYLNDTVTYRGTVRGKRAGRDGRRLDCELWSENERAERLASAQVVVLLP